MHDEGVTCFIFIIFKSPFGKGRAGAGAGRSSGNFFSNIAKGSIQFVIYLLIIVHF